MASSKLFIYDATLIPHAALLLFSGSQLQFTSHKRNRVVVGGWIEMELSELHAVLYRRLQKEIEQLLRLIVEQPEGGLRDIRRREANLQAVVTALLK